MTNSFDCCDLWLERGGQQPRRHSWPEAETTLKPSTSGIFEPLPDQEEIALRSSMTSRASNHSGSCILKASFQSWICMVGNHLIATKSVHIFSIIRFPHHSRFFFSVTYIQLGRSRQSCFCFFNCEVIKDRERRLF